MLVKKSMSSDKAAIEYPDVFKGNLMENIAKEVNITRRTIYEILKRIDKDKFSGFMKHQ